MFQGTLLFAIVTAASAAGLTFAGTGSFWLSAFAYVCAGMAVLLALLIAEMMTGGSDAEQSAEKPLVPVKAHG